MGPAPVQNEAGQSGQQAQVRCHRRGHRAGRRFRLGHAWRNWATTSSCFCFHDSPRRAHSIAAQGGINAAKNYRNDGDSVYRLFYDTVKGGDFRSREANVYRLAQVSLNIIDQCVAQGVPFAREYGGMLDNRSFGGAQVSRTFYARGQTGQQLLLGAYQALMRQVGREAGEDVSAPRNAGRGGDRRPGARHHHPRSDHRRDRDPRRPMPWSWRPAVTATSSIFRPTPRARNVTATWRAHKRGALFANPCFTQIHPTCIPVTGEHQSKLTLMSESLRNDGRIWVPANEGRQAALRTRFPEAERDYFLERRYPSFGNLVPRDVASRERQGSVRRGPRRGRKRLGVYLDFRDAIERLGEEVIRERYGNLFDMYERITGEDPYEVPDAHLPGRALHHGRAVGRLQPDEHHSGPVRAGRGEFLRSRRQPPGRQRADAGPGRRLFHPSVHHRRLPGHRQARTRRHQSRGVS